MKINVRLVWFLIVVALSFVSGWRLGELAARQTSTARLDTYMHDATHVALFKRCVSEIAPQITQRELRATDAEDVRQLALEFEADCSVTSGLGGLTSKQIRDIALKTRAKNAKGGDYIK